MLEFSDWFLILYFVLNIGLDPIISVSLWMNAFAISNEVDKYVRDSIIMYFAGQSRKRGKGNRIVLENIFGNWC